MANIQQKTNDPTEDALNAIEEALAVRSPAPPVSVSSVDRSRGSATSVDTDDLFNDEPLTTDWTDKEGSQLAANDDRANVGHILQTLRRRPARMPFVIAGIAALAWTASILGTAYLYHGELQALLTTPRLAGATFAALAGATIVPVIFFFVLGHMFRRTQDMRNVAETMAEVAIRFGQPEITAREAIVTVGQAIRREVAAMGDGVERALARAAELESLVHNEVSALERAYNDNEVRIRDLLAELANQRETLVNQAEQVRNAIASVHLDLSHDITSVGDLVSDKVSEVAQRVTRSLTEKGEHITLALGHAGDSMIDTLSERGSTLLDRLETTSDRATSAIASASEQLTESLKFKTENIHAEFAELSDHLQQMMGAKLDQVAQEFGQKTSATIEQMASHSQRITAAFNNATDQVAETITARGTDVIAKLEQTSGEVSERIIGRGNDVVMTFRDSAETLAQTIDSRGDAVKEMLNTRLKAFEDMFSHGGTELTEKISRDATTLGSLITRYISEFDHTVKAYGGELVERLAARTQDVSEAMRTYVDGFDARVGGRTEELNESIDQRLANFEELLVNRAETIAGEIENRTRAAADAVHASMEQLSQTIKVNSAEAEQSLGQLASTASDTIRTSTGEAERILRDASEEVASNFVGKANEISDTVKKRAQEIETILSDKSGSVIDAIAQKGQQFAEDIASASAQAMASIEEKGSTFTRSVLENSTEMSRLVNTAGATAAEAVTRALTDLHEATQRAIAQSKETAAAAVTEMVETHNMLRSDSTALFERLREANIMLQEVLSGSHANMSTLENALMLRVSEFVAAMNEVNASTGDATNRVEANVGHFREVTSQLLRDLSNLSGQFDAHGQELAKAADLIEQSNLRTDETVNQRRAQLDSLVSTMDLRTAELEQHLQHFSGLLDQSLEAAASRAREVVSAVAEASNEGTRALNEEYQRVRTQAEELAQLVSQSGADSAREITEQFNRIREHTDTERRRVANAMHDVFEQSAGETQALFREANERFAATVRDMKQMAVEMQRELETTRNELRRGVLELPQEASESTAQMRRVIVDQIEALAELNRIIARHGRSLDAVEPGRRSREEPSLSVVGGRTEPMPRAEAPSRPRNNDGGGFAPSPRRPALETTSTPASPQGSTGRGWLSDLLNRASREESEPRDYSRESREPLRGADERSPRHTIESLDSLSVDIARMIDHDAATDLWDRYKRGERNVFTRRLYTLQGQQAFDEIRKKYRADREFKQTVDRYVDEFERLLDEVSRDDRGQVVARTYLTSETGKVYTMLAHAAGRFD